MGNCVKGQAAVSWADDDEEAEWEWAESGHRRRHSHGAGSEERQGLLKEDERGVNPAATEVKIKITKRQLEELLRKVDAQGLPLHQVLAHLTSGAIDDALHDRPHHWRPALQSIPEAAE
uniref:Porphobilinogen deaminase n=1 Tax=Anthurium amnicola TaxID=1678845 RepID=A0A1D1XVF6_9ARAE